MNSTTRTITRQLKRALAPIVYLSVVVAGGCSSGYHAEWCGCVPYEYCPPCPLPFTDYCGCETPLAQEYRHRLESELIPNVVRPNPISATPANESNTPVVELPW